MNKLQIKVKDFCTQNQMNAPLEFRMLDLTSEIGELSKEVLKMTDYGSKPLKYMPEFKNELGDVLYALITLANYFEIDLDESIDETLAKYKRRMAKGSAGSEND